MNTTLKIITFTVLFFIQSTALFAQDKLAGDWKGDIDIQRTKLVVITHFSRTDSGFTGTIDIPQQGGQDIPLENISISKSDSVHFEFMAGLGMAEFDGIITGNQIKGTFLQNGQTFPFQLMKINQTKAQKSEDPLAYNQQQLTIKNDSISIAGTLAQPKNKKADKLVIIISGSGAQNRDGKIPVTTFKPYAALAESLTTNGIATFRYDDRGVGQSSGNYANATLDMLASDVEAIITHFTENSSQSFSEIILLGHSQGGVVAGKVAAENSLVDKLILMASTGVTLKKILRFQVRQAFEQANVDTVLVNDEIAAREQLMEAIKSGENVEEAKENYRGKFRTVQLSLGMDSARASSLAQKQVQQLTSTFQSPHVTSLLHYDPTNDLQKLNIPVLVLFGGKDTQVTTEMNKLAIEKALDSAGLTHQTEVFESANHLFQKAKTGSVQEYATLESKFVDGFIPTLTNWIK